MKRIVHSTLREQIADAIKVMVIKHEVEPGMRIIEADIAKAFNVSHGPVREALRQLEQEGIVEYTRNSGCSIRKIDPEEIIEVLIIRCNIEYIAVKACNGKFSEGILADFRDVLELMRTSAQENADPEEIDSQFHRILIMNSHMPHLLKEWDTLEYIMTFTFSSIDNYDEYMSMTFYDNHRFIYDAFESGDIDRINDAIYNHYMHSVRKTMEQNGLTENDFPFLFGAAHPHGCDTSSAER